jgi:Zn-dependent peptidase ImmA (M78 family)
MMALSAAEKILLGLGITDPADIDLEAIAWSLGALVKYRPMDKCEATIVGSSKRAVIAVNSNSSPTRQRFSIGHEIGHWHHHRGRMLLCGQKDIGNPADDALNVERQADNFASDLILPNFLFRPAARKIKRVSLDAIRDLAEVFQASATATIIKLIEADDFSIMAVCHGKKHRRWFRRAASIPGWWFPRQELDHETFAFELLFNGGNEQKFPRKIGADAWFDFRNADQYEVTEQSFLLPNEEVLTLLTIPET